MRKSVYIVGTGSTAYFLQDLLDTEKVEFKGYVSSNPETRNQVTRGCYPLVSMEQLKSEQYEYLIFCEDAEYDKSDIRNISLINSMSYLCMRMSPEFFVFRKKALSDMSTAGICGLVTGMSYVQRGLIPEKLSKLFCMGACPTQDLYYDFFTLADAVGRLGSKLKYVVMGLAPYSLRYDLSLSKENNARTLYYYREFGDAHNMTLSEEILEPLERNDKALDEICYPIWRNILFDSITDGPYGRVEDVFCFGKCDEIQQRESLDKMARTSNKPYPETVRENEMVFDMYMKLCSKHGIKVTVLLTPFSGFFRDHFPTEYVEELRNLIHGYQEKYGYEILDLYDSPLFMDDGDYADEDHLNVYGAEKMTEILEVFLAERVYGHTV